MGNPLHMQKMHAMQITRKCEDVQSEKKTQMFIRVHYSKAFSTNPGTW